MAEWVGRAGEVAFDIVTKSVMPPSASVRWMGLLRLSYWMVD